ncbi:MAG: ABC transporter permease [Lachnospiraceae bacterium]|nr:ABC transporter permease [Lachnospiraceae bacterium]
MNLEFIRMILLSVKRRRRSMWKVALISFCCVFLFAGIMIFQDCMNRFQRENAFLESGEWIISTGEKSRCLEEHAWVDGYGTTLVRTEMCSQPRDMDMDHAKGYGPVGVVDEEFVHLSNIVLYSGKMPEQADEIVITQHVLSAMGHSFELGQTISLAYITGYNELGEPEYGYVKYKLSGILENYTADWTASEGLPEYFVTKEGLESIQGVEMEDQQRYWYYLNRAQRDINGEEYYRSMMTMCKKQGEDRLLFDMVYNSNAYDVTMWGSRNLYLVMMSLCGILGSMSLIYLFLMCCNNRRPYYFKLRELGASTGQVRGMVCLEWSGVFLPAAIVGILMTGVVSLIVAAVISRHFGIPFVFHITGNSLAMILLFTLGVFLLVMIWSCLLFRVKNLHQMTGMISKGRLKHMYRKRDRRKKAISLFQIRRRRAEPGKSMAQILFIIATMTIFLYSLWAIRSAYHTWQESEGWPDIYAYVRGEGMERTSEGITWYENPCHLESNQIKKELVVTRGDSVGNGISMDVVADLMNIPGVKQVNGTANDNQIGLVWDGMEDSGFLKDWYVKTYLESDMQEIANIMKYSGPDLQEWQDEWHGMYNQVFAEIPKAAERPECFGENIIGLAKTAERDRLLHKLLGEDFRSDDFWSGKQSILFLLSYNGSGTWVFDDIPIDSPIRKPLQGILNTDDQNRTFFYGKWGEEYPYHFEEKTIKTGDPLQIHHKLLTDENAIHTEVICSDDAKLFSALMRDPVMSGKVESYLFDVSQLTNFEGDEEVLTSGGGVQLLASEAILEQLAKSIGKDFTYRCIQIDMEKGVNRKQVEAGVADVLSSSGEEEDGISFHSYMGKKAQERRRFYRQFAMFGVILILTGSVYLFINRSMQNKSMELVRKQLQQFLQCGCSREDLIRFYTVLRIREGIWALAGIPLCMLILVVVKGIAYWKETRGGEIDFERAELWKQCINMIRDYLNHPFEWILFLGFLVLAIWFGIRGQARYLKKLELMGQEE